MCVRVRVRVPVRVMVRIRFRIRVKVRVKVRVRVRERGSAKRGEGQCERGGTKNEEEHYMKKEAGEKKRFRVMGWFRRMFERSS